MKHLQLRNSGYEHLESAFAEWLDILGYSRSVTYNMPNMLREFLHFLEGQGCERIDRVEQRHYRSYFARLTGRRNLRRGGGLSNSYINKHLQTLEKLHEFLAHKGGREPSPVTLRQLRSEKGDITVLAQEEVQQLYRATENGNGHRHERALNARDRAMLTVFYGCGLRRNEGVNLTVDDIDFDRRTLHVRKGKNHRERFVPFSRTGADHLREWIYDHRADLVRGRREGALFIGRTGRPMSGNGLYVRFRLLRQRTEDPELRGMDIGLHALRHSIATHLLQNGMELGKIQRFLGHGSLESTQIYTHLIQKEDGQL